jgi:hypothetical protein
MHFERFQRYFIEDLLRIPQLRAAGEAISLPD